MCTKEFNVSCFVYLDSNQGFSFSVIYKNLEVFAFLPKQKKVKKKKNNQIHNKN